MKNSGSSKSTNKTSPNLQIINLKYVEGYKLWLEFSDGKTQAVDFEPFLSASLHPEIEKYLKLQNFKKFKLENGELMWGDYDLIFPIIDLYENRLYINQKKV